MKQLFFILVAIGMLVFPVMGQAQIGELTPAQCDQLGIKCPVPEGGAGAERPIVTRISSIMNTLLGFVAIAAVIVLIIGGAMYIFSFGNEDTSKRAKHLILNVIIGLLIIAVSALLVNFIIRIFFT